MRRSRQPTGENKQNGKFTPGLMQVCLKRTCNETGLPGIWKVIKVAGSQERALETTKGGYTVSLLLTENIHAQTHTHTHVLYTYISANTHRHSNTHSYIHTHKHIVTIHRDR